MGAGVQVLRAYLGLAFRAGVGGLVGWFLISCVLRFVGTLGENLYYDVANDCGR